MILYLFLSLLIVGIMAATVWFVLLFLASLAGVVLAVVVVLALPFVVAGAIQALSGKCPTRNP